MNFDVLSDPLPSRLFIEASAGTGKTYTLEKLVLRLLREKSIPLRKILIVTFTREGTTELKKRIREMLATHCLKADQTKLPKGQVTQAVVAIGDDLSVYTIDGFFSHCLRSYFLEAHLSPSNCVVEGDELAKKAVYQFFRRQDYEIDPTVYEGIVDLYGNMDNLVDALTGLLTKTSFSQVTLKPTAEDRKRFLDGLNSFDSRGDDAQGTLYALFQDWINDVRSKNTDYGNAREILIALEKFLDRIPTIHSTRHLIDFLSLPVDDKSDVWGKIIRLATYKKHALGSAYRLASHLLDPSLITDQSHVAKLSFKKLMGIVVFTRWLEETAWPALERELDDLKQAQNTLFYSDLSKKLNELIQQRPDIAQKIGNQYDAVLIDEFQDTSIPQWSVMERLFAHCVQYLVVVGDPKQAIFGFRGGDVDAYQNIKKIPFFRENIVRLPKNFRSSKRLLESLNLFSSRLLGDGYTPLQWGERESSGKDPAPPQEEEDAHYPPFVVYHQPKEEILQQFVNAILHLRDQGVPLGKIAILSSRRNTLEEMETHLTKAFIPFSRINTSKSILETKEGKTILELLALLSLPRDKDLANRFLLGDFFSLTPQNLIDLYQESELLYTLRSKLVDASVAFQERGIAHSVEILDETASFLHKMLNKALYQREKHLLERDPSLRSLAYYAQLFELVEMMRKTQNLTAMELYTALSEQKRRLTQVEEENFSSNLYTARDEDHPHSVKLMTIHTSKGLEYDYVFVLYKPGKPHKGLCHHYLLGERHIYDYFKMNDEDYEQQKKKEEREGKNLCYVAATRGIKRVFMGYLLTRGNKSAPLVNDLDALLRDYPHLFQKEPLLEGGIHIQPVTPKTETPPLVEPILLNGDQFPQRFIETFSYSSILARRGHYYSPLVGLTHEEEEKTDDADENEVLLDTHLPRRLEETRGTHLGLFVHQLLEKIPFQGFEVLSRENLFNEHVYPVGRDFFSPDWMGYNRESLLNMLYNVLHAPLLTESGGGDSFQLCELQETEKRAELEFLFKLNPMGSWSSFQLEKIKMHRTKEAYLGGVIDLVFTLGGRYYLLDWKSNDLGGDYGQSAMEAEMKRSDYELQAHLYLSALYFFLKTTQTDFDYDRDVGGIYYLFIRGMEVNAPSPSQQGIWHLRPSKQDMETFIKEIT